MLTRYLPFATSTTDAQAATYLLSVCLFSISFLVFLNSSVSFAITDLLGERRGVGDRVGTLGFADELVALVACPAWGLASDRLGVRHVCVLGYTIVGLALVLFVQAGNVYPQMLLARMLFSVGGAATATMVTAILPTVAGGARPDAAQSPASAIDQSGRTPRSMDSQATVTPDRYAASTRTVHDSGASPPRLAGLVGMFTGCGALVALVLFLPLPAQFSHLKHVTQAQAVTYSFYVVGGVAFIVAGTCYLGLRNLQGEENKGWALLVARRRSKDSSQSVLPYWTLIRDASVLGLQDANIGLGYLGGFVARASSVGISLFIPLYVNAYFIRHGFCQGSPNDTSPEMKKECRAAYVLAAELTGISQMVALLCAPAFGYLSDRYRRFNIPLLCASFAGIIGYIGFAELHSPELSDIHGRGGGYYVLIMVMLMGISQIGAIVCSLGLLGRGVLGEHGGYTLSSQLRDATDGSYGSTRSAEERPLLADSVPKSGGTSRAHLKGSIAGVYSLSGGAAILILTKLGGYLFDAVDTGAPFYLMAFFNATLLLVGIAVGLNQKFAHEDSGSSD